MARLLCSKNLVLVHVPSLAPALSLSHSPLCSPARCDCSVWLSSMFLSIAALCGFHSWGQGGILSTEVRNEKWNAGFFFLITSSKYLTYLFLSLSLLFFLLVLFPVSIFPFSYIHFHLALTSDLLLYINICIINFRPAYLVFLPLRYCA